ncbi:MAG: CaiB/BaiF CoA transferase family protein [Thalassovita sp.]
MAQTGALDGLLVVALEQAVAAPYCSLRLADAGARVIKIERPEGDLARHYDSAIEGESAAFHWLNRGKESVILDLKHSDGAMALRRLLSKADVFLHNLAPGAVDRLGFGPKVLRAEFPRLISVAIAGYGSDTPMVKAKAYDMLIQAESGLCSMTGTPEVPSKTGVSVADLVAGMNAHALILEALIARQKTGMGQDLEVTLFDGMADFMTHPLVLYEREGVVPGRHGLAHGAIYPYRTLTCLDGEILIAVQNAREWRRFCADILGLPDLADDPRFATNEARVRNRALLDRLIEPAFAVLSCAAAKRQLDDAQIANAKRSEIADLPQHPALRRMEVPLRDGGVLGLPRPAGRDMPIGRPAPALGADTDRILNEFHAMTAEN